MIGYAQHHEGDEKGNDQHGIQYNHAYGMLRIEDLPQQHGWPSALQLIYTRNPWGTSQGEWAGKFSDEDEAWDDHKYLRKEILNYEFNENDNWWMRFEDWKTVFNRLYVCKIFPETWSQYSVTGEWKGNTNGGPLPPE